MQNDSANTRILNSIVAYRLAAVIMFEHSALTDRLCW